MSSWELGCQIIPFGGHNSPLTELRTYTLLRYPKYIFINTEMLSIMDCVQKSYTVYGQKEEVEHLILYYFPSLKYIQRFFLRSR